MKKIIISFLTIFILIFSVTTGYVPNFHSNVALADKEETNKAKSKFLEEVDKYSGNDAKGTDGLLDKIYKDSDTRKRENSIIYALKRIVDPTFYVYNVEDGVFGSSDKEKSLLVDETVRLDDGTVCTDNEPQNLLNHNCDIPNPVGEVAQAVGDVLLSSGIINGTKTASKSSFNFGVPNGLPGDGTVPVNPSERVAKYTALELYGYDLNFTEYKGEWDRITPSTAARLMANFGLFDAFKVGGTAAFNGAKAGFKAITHTKNFSWNPVKWIGNILNEAAGAALNTIIDTSELNIVATHAWLRPNFPLYNVGTLSNKDIITASQKSYYEKFPALVEEEAMKDPEVKEMFELENPPEFNYDPNWEKGESVAAREKIRKQNELHPDRQLPEPEPVYFTKEEQFGFYKKDNGHDEFFSKAKSKGISCGDKDNYEDLKACWGGEWKSMAERTMDHKKDVMKKAEEKATERYLAENIYDNPGTAISHYVCLDENDKIIGQPGSYKYYYKKQNTRTSESVDSSCRPPRPSIKGGLFGTGDKEYSNDTRRQVFEESHGWSSLLSPFTSVAKNTTGFIQGIGQLATKITNEMLNFSFTEILTALGITTVIEKLIESLRESFFYPLLVAGFAVTGVNLLYRTLRTMSLRDFFQKLLAIFLTLFLGILLLHKPTELVGMIEKYPTKIDNAILNMFTDTNKQNDICASSGSDKDGVRTMQCTVWKYSVFDPWVNGQFGTGYQNLFANGYASEGLSSNSKQMNNKNSLIVGSAEVNMGGGQIAHNWALYQLDKMKSGTITTIDSKNTEGVLDNNLYRLVDLQAGPKNGQDSDSRYLGSWIGSPGTRLLYAFLGTIVSLTSMIVMGGLAILKIEYTLMFTALLLMLPMMLVLGLFGIKGNYKFIEYFSSLIATFAKRTAVVFIMAISLRILRLIAESPAPYSLIFVGLMGILGALLVYRSEMVSWISPQGQGSFAQFVNNPKAMSQTLIRNIPMSVQVGFSQWKGAFIGGSGGLIGGVLAGAKDGRRNQKALKELKEKGIDTNSPEVASIYKSANLLQNALKGGITGMRQAQAQQESRIFNKQRRHGQFGILNITRNSKLAVEEDSIQRVMADPVLKASYLQLAQHSKYLKNKLIDDTGRNITDAMTKNQEAISQIPNQLDAGIHELKNIEPRLLQMIRENEKIQNNPNLTNQEKEDKAKEFAKEYDELRVKQYTGVKSTVNYLRRPGQTIQRKIEDKKTFEQKEKNKYTQKQISRHEINDAYKNIERDLRKLKDDDNDDKGDDNNE